MVVRITRGGVHTLTGSPRMVVRLNFAVCGIASFLHISTNDAMMRERYAAVKAPWVGEGGGMVNGWRRRYAHV